MAAIELGTPTRVPSEDDLDRIAGACAFLANLLLRPEAGAAVVANLTHDDVVHWPFAGTNAATAQGLDHLGAAIAEPVAADVLEEDYRRLFVGPGTMLAPPWESVHRDPEGLMFQEETMNVRHAYAEFGLEAPALHKEPDDHLGLELAFVGELAVAALKASEDGDVVGQTMVLDGMRRFTAEHLLVWVPDWCEHVITGAQTQLYRATGWLLRGAVQAMGKVLVG
ncbi:TorD/DmsD family molecular chaperone [Propionibacteriaceae bacterium G1746]